MSPAVTRRVSILGLSLVVACASGGVLTEGDPADPFTAGTDSAPMQEQVQPPPPPVEGPLTVDHPAEARARWVTNPVAWTADSPGVYREVFDPPAARERSLVARAERRSYEGAPPPMAHSADYGGTLGCLDCHEVGRAIGSRIARPMSHQPMSACTQCHVPQAPEPIAGQTPPVLAVSAFLGMVTPAPGSRAFEGAPPTIPHTTHLRVRCLSCHGEFGYAGLRTDHPTRASCTQCHVQRGQLRSHGMVFGR